MQIVFESPTARTEWSEEQQTVILTQIGKNDGESLRRSLDTGLAMLQEKKAYKWLSDNRDMAVHAQADYEWVNNDWTPRALQSGWQKWAMIQPRSALSAISEKKFVDFFSENGVEVRIFESLEQGFEWLASV
jgi:hypothetical protein